MRGGNGRRWWNTAWMAPRSGNCWGRGLLRDDQVVTASCAEGVVGQIYEGRIPFETITTDLSGLPATRTPLMLNVGSPDTAFGYAQLPHQGVGLAREEFIINNYIQAHPLALLRHEGMGDMALSASIAKLTRGYRDGAEYFIAQLSFGIARIAAAFYPKKVIVRFSDFKSNEYRNLLGGKYFEPEEENPMIGWRGASRYYSDSYEPSP